MNSPHGGPDALGIAAHDFSTNSNACGPCPTAWRAVQAADATRYPDPSYAALRQQLAAWHGVEVSRVLLAASASEFILRLSVAVAQAATADGDRAVWMPASGYGDYASAAQAAGLRRVDAPGKAALRWACEPSSPLGQGEPALTSLPDTATDESITVLDCAYAPLRLSGRPSLAASALERVWQLWTPNKALGLTGVRAAYAIAPARAGQTTLLATLRALQPSWVLGAHGVALLQAWTHADTQQWLSGSLDTLRVWKAQQLAVCEELGWPVRPSDANFFVARPDVADLPATLMALRQQGIKLRDTASFGLPGQVRLGVLPPDAQQALARAWRSLAVPEVLA